MIDHRSYVLNLNSWENKAWKKKKKKMKKPEYFFTGFIFLAAQAEYITEMIYHLFKI